TETQERLEVTLGVSRDVLLASAFSTQHGGAAFTEAKPAERKRVFAEILDLGLWDALAEQARAELRDAKDRVVGEAHLVAQYEGALDRADSANAKLRAALDEKVVTQLAEIEAEKEAQRLAAEADAARAAVREHEEAV